MPTRIRTPAEIKQMATLGLIAQASGDRVLAPIGKQMLGQSGDLTELDALQNYRDAANAEDTRWHDAQTSNWSADEKYQRDKLAADVAEKAKDRALELQLKRMDISADDARAAAASAAATPVDAQGRPLFSPTVGVPTNQMKNELSKLRQQRSAIAGGVGAAKANPSAFGMGPGTALERWGGDIGAGLAQWTRNPEDSASRAFVLNNVSKIINERAGAAQSAQELQRLNSFLPSATDDAPSVEAKFNAFQDYIDEQESALRGYSSDELGFTRRTGAGPRKPENGGKATGGFKYLGSE